MLIKVAYPEISCVTRPILHALDVPIPSPSNLPTSSNGINIHDEDSEIFDNNDFHEIEPFDNISKPLINLL